MIFFKYRDKQYFFSTINANPFEFSNLIFRFEEMYIVEPLFCIEANENFNSVKENFKPASELLKSWKSSRNKEFFVLDFHKDAIMNFDENTDIICRFIDFFSL